MARQPKVQGFSKAERAAAHKAKEDATGKTPRVVLDAFLPERIAAGELELPPVSIFSYMALELGAPTILKPTPVTILLADGSELTGTLLARDEKLLTLRTAKATLKVAEQDIVHWETKFDLFETMRALFILTQPEDLVERLLGARFERQDTSVALPEFNAAVNTFARGIPPNVIPLIGKAIERALEAGFKPAIPFGVDKNSGSDSPFSPART